MMPTLLLLLILSSASLQNTVNSQDRTVSSLTPDLKDKVPEITANISVSRRLLPPAPSRQKKSLFYFPSENGKLRWHRWNGSLPNGSVSIYNDYVKCIDFVCRHKCHSGFYRPSQGPRCHIPRDGAEIRTTDFQILVNKDDFETLKWKHGSHGSVPQNSVRTCADVYVGKNEYGLGKVVPEQRAFFLPWKGSEYWYGKSYKVLTTDNDVESNLMTDVRYNTGEATVVSQPPETIHVFVAKNHDCNPMSKSITYTKTVREVKRWDLSSSITLGVKTVFEAGLPNVVSGKLEISAVKSFQASGGNSVTEEISHSVSVNLSVPPNHSCRVRMVGYEYAIHIPFTARFRRTYKSGKIAWTTLSGQYDDVQLGEVDVVLDRCTPIPNASPCPKQNVQR